MKTWWRPFQLFLEDKKNMTWDQMETTTEFRTMLRLFLEKLRKTQVNNNITFNYSDFLFDVNNAKQQFNFKFAGELECNRPSPPIIASQMELQ